MIRLFNQYFSPKSIVMLGLEAIWMTAAVLCAARLRFWSSPDEFELYIMSADFVVMTTTFVAIFAVCFYVSDLYNLATPRQRLDEFGSLGQALGAGCMVLSAIYFLFPPVLMGRGVFFISILLIIAFIAASRLVFHAAWQIAIPQQQVVILGTGKVAANVAREITTRRDLNLCLAGFLDLGEPSDGCTMFSGAPVLGSAKSIDSVVAGRHISRIIVALELGDTLPADDLVRARVSGIPVEHAESTVASLTGRVWLEGLQPSWIVFSDGFRRSPLTMMLKRAFDLVLSGLGLLAASPLMLLIICAVRLDSPGRIIFRQSRVGFKGKSFEVLKFRSMREDAEKPGEAKWAVKNDPRTTRIGSFLRKFRFDELPQLINVLRGDMSFVGPRPERLVFVKEFRKEIPFYDERHSVRPGITGWAQVQYPYGAGIDDAIRKLEYDLYYVKNMSVLLDMLIVLKTIRIVLTGEGGR